MLEALKSVFGMGASVDYAQLMKEGAVIVDVRSTGEYAGGHINQSLNIPLDVLSSKIHVLKHKDLPVITCCASGMRSAAAKKILEGNGFTKVYNGGGWNSLQSKL